MRAVAFINLVAVGAAGLVLANLSDAAAWSTIGAVRHAVYNAPESPAATVRALRVEFNQALATRDSVVFNRVLADSVTLVSPLQLYRGRASGVSHYMGLLGHGEKITLEFEPIDVQDRAPFVSEYGKWHQSWAGGQRQITGTYFAVWSLTVDGRWVLDVQAWTSLKCTEEPCPTAVER
jgi:ketosteroid isomerase-like protein